MIELTTDANEMQQLVAGMSGRQALAARHILTAREYTFTLLDGLSEDDWFWTPAPAITHIAWQVGHLAFAQYGLMLFRQRGRKSEDAQLMSGKFRKTFAKGTTPTTQRESYPGCDEIIQTLHRIHLQGMKELASFGDADLDQEVDRPWAAYATRFGALLFAGDHEMLHAGQIGLLRRLMGKEPVR